MVSWIIPIVRQSKTDLIHRQEMRPLRHGGIFTKWLPPWRKGRISCLWIKSVFDCLTIGIIHETMVVHMTWVWTFFNNYSNHPRMCVLSTLCGNVDKHSPFDIYIYIYILPGMSGGKRTLSAITCSCDLGNIDIDTHGSLSLTYDFILDLYKEAILSKAQQLVGIKKQSRLGAWNRLVCKLHTLCSNGYGAWSWGGTEEEGDIW